MFIHICCDSKLASFILNSQLVVPFTLMASWHVIIVGMQRKVYGWLSATQGIHQEVMANEQMVAAIHSKAQQLAETGGDSQVAAQSTHILDRYTTLQDNVKVNTTHQIYSHSHIFHYSQFVF